MFLCGQPLATRLDYMGRMLYSRRIVRKERSKILSELEYGNTGEILALPSIIKTGYSAAPLLLTGEGSEPFVQRQDKFHEDICNLIDSELGRLGTSRKVTDWVKSSVMSRMFEREGLNSAKFNYRLYDTPNYSRAPGFDRHQINKACEAALCGFGSLEQNRIAQLALGMESAEYANLTIVGDSRKDSEANMWQEASQLVGHDVLEFSGGNYRARLLDYDRNPLEAQHLGAIRFILKRTLATGGEFDTVMKARTSVILDTSPHSGFDEALVQQIIATERHNASAKNPSEIKDIMQISDLRSVVDRLVAENFDSPLVLARNETIYGFSGEISAEVEAQRQAHHEKAAKSKLGGGVLTMLNTLPIPLPFGKSRQQ